jgi:hypothetical protein
MPDSLFPPSEEQVGTTSTPEPHQIVREYIQASEQVLLQQDGLSNLDKLLLLDIHVLEGTLTVEFEDGSQVLLSQAVDF